MVDLLYQYTYKFYFVCENGGGDWFQCSYAESKAGSSNIENSMD